MESVRLSRRALIASLGAIGLVAAAPEPVKRYWFGHTFEPEPIPLQAQMHHQMTWGRFPSSEYSYNKWIQIGPHSGPDEYAVSGYLAVDNGTLGMWRMGNRILAATNQGQHYNLSMEGCYHWNPDTGIIEPSKPIIL